MDEKALERMMIKKETRRAIVLYLCSSRPRLLISLDFL